jgi:hypothetical protein
MAAILSIRAGGVSLRREITALRRGGAIDSFASHHGNP